MSEQFDRKQPGWYYRLSQYFRQKYGHPVYKIPLDAGFSCPNRDGTIGKTGCSYCHNPSFAPFINDKKPSANPAPITEQLQRGMKKRKEAKYLAYFQSYTNTYAPLNQLKKLYDEALCNPDVIGLSIATRPDCITEEILELIEEYAQRYHVWIEYGLQSAHDQTLNLINRGHDAASFERAVKLTRGRNIPICAHIILGLPGETASMMLETIAFLNHLGVDGVKFHHLQVIKGTPLAEQYARGELSIYEKEEDYIPTLCDCLEHLAPNVVIHRLASQATSKDLLIAPHWTMGAGQLAALVEYELKKRGTYQGYRTFKVSDQSG